MNQHHPYVSEVHEGKPAFEWCVLGVVIVALVVAFLGYTMAATVIIAVTAIVTALLRIIMREKSPWKSPVSPVRRHYRHRFGAGTASVVFRTVTVLDSLTEPGAPH